jgi:Flp pilus assembly protein TadD
LREALEIDPDYWVAHLGLGRVLILRNRVPDAIEPLRLATSLSGGAVEATTQLAYALARTGHEAEARDLMRDLEARSSRTHVPAYAFAMIENGLRNREAALSHLERSVEAREVQAAFLEIDARWNWLRADPRFAALRERLGLR